MAFLQGTHYRLSQHSKHHPALKKHMEKIQVQSGNLLVAEPFMLDPNFKRAVVLMCEHSEEGSLGFIINRKLDVYVDELIDEFPDFPAKVYFGGPVQTDTIHYLHNVGDLLEDSREVARGVFWGGNFEKLKFLISNEVIKPENIRFYLGYSGWSEGQLEEELKIGSWVVADMDPNYIFKSKPSKLWNQVLNHKGDRYSVIATIPDTPNWN